ncbi:FadR family transcriptional regulator [Viridibacillus sp. YIM B01967]|uniref:FadR family transcriptional regulator n=1 Tax=Viridibacillus soli TaxID=2798301 RepID=A0ABS1H2Q4_9BACL|nr:GntR family transcriptional regulator [Viridibacillus soli]MBK3493581.1 FadR family transcriptional regulator [Viridibacillus soli]
MSIEKPTSKMFIQIVSELRALIRDENIPAGGKIPSERVLAERLNVGRSSVREALRSLELLGLIETRRGGGTFITDFRNHKLVEVLSTFILHEETDLENVNETRKILERDAIRIVSANETLRKLPVWDSLCDNLELEGIIAREDIMREIVIASENRLVLKIWILLKQYGKEAYNGFSTEQEQPILQAFISELMIGNTAEAISSFEEWTELLHKGRDIL